MSPSAEPQDDGFSLVEIIVALGVLMIVMVALLPQLVLGIQATGSARLATQAKGVAQGQLEKMRNLPYHVTPDAGDFLDVLDTYYVNLTAAVTPACMSGDTYALPSAGWSGYVAASGARCAYEPAGAFYRTVSTVAAAAAGADFTVVVDTRFLSATTPPLPVTPPVGYNSVTENGARPAASQIGVTVTVLYRDKDQVRAVTTSTQIADRPAATVRVRTEASATAVDVGSETTANGPVSLTAGVLNLAGSLTYASTVKANLAGTSASLATGEQNAGASRSLTAPPITSTQVEAAGSGSLGTSGCDLACWGATTLNLPPLSTAGGLPSAGSAATPMQSLLTGTGHHGISFGNSSSSQYRPELDLVSPLLRLHADATAVPSGVSATCTSGGSGTSSYITAAGYLRTTAATDAVAPNTVESCATARTSVISLFPTTYAAGGVVKIELTRASAHCQVSGVAHTPSVAYDYFARIWHWDGSEFKLLATIEPGMATDPLDTLDLSLISVGGGHKLSDYVASWSSVLPNEITATAAEGIAEVTVPGVITIASQPTRPDQDAVDKLDATSVVSVAVGALGCLAEDTR